MPRMRREKAKRRKGKRKRRRERRRRRRGRRVRKMTLKMVSNADSAAVCVARLSLFLGEFVCTLNFVVFMNCVV